MGSFGLKTYVDDDIQILLRQVRDFMRDHGALNALIQGQESGDPLLELFIDMAVDDWNTTPPFIGNVTVSRHPARSLLILYASALCLWSASILQARNNLTYSDGGLSVNTSDKARPYQEMAAQIMQMYESKKMRHKKSQNAEMAYGGVYSEYTILTFSQYQQASYEAYANFRDGWAP